MKIIGVGYEVEWRDRDTGLVHRKVAPTESLARSLVRILAADDIIPVCRQVRDAYPDRCVTI